MHIARSRTNVNRRPAAHRRTVAVVGALLVGALAFTGCSSDPKYTDAITTDVALDSLLEPQLTVSELGDRQITDASTEVQPGAPIVVTAKDGSLTEVRIDKSDGSPLKGELSEDGTTWRSAEALGYGRQYTLRADAVGIGGTNSKSVSFRTTSPTTLTHAYLSPIKGSTVGVGQPIAVKFDENIADRKAAEAAITVKTEPEVEGGFYWISNSEVRWRPKEYWKTGTKVSVDVNTYGIDLGDGMYGQENVSTDFTVGRSMIITADDATKEVVFEQDGKIIRRMPTSMGKDATPTPNGVYLISDKHDNMIMDSSTYGVPVNAADGYRTPVDYATRMSYSGIFFHSAPWSLWAQGNTNTSHGCLNLSPADALWVMENTLRGDPVIVKNTVGETLSGVDGLGDWNIPWAQWSKGNA